MTPQQPNSTVLILVSEDPDAEGQPRTVQAGADGHFSMTGIAPGRYRLYAASGMEGAALQQNPRVLKALEGRAARVELEAGARSTVQAQLISGEEIMQAFQEVE
jgi:hypothetical protein